MDDPVVSLPAVVIALIVSALILWWLAWMDSKKEPPKKPADKPKEPPPKPKEPKAPGGIFSEVEKEIQTLLFILEESEPKHANVVVSAMTTKVLDSIRKHDEAIAKYATEVKAYGEAWDRYPK